MTLPKLTPSRAVNSFVGLGPRLVGKNRTHRRMIARPPRAELLPTPSPASDISRPLRVEPTPLPARKVFDRLIGMKQVLGLSVATGLLAGLCTSSTHAWPRILTAVTLASTLVGMAVSSAKKTLQAVVGALEGPFRDAGAFLMKCSARAQSVGQRGQQLVQASAYVLWAGLVYVWQNAPASIPEPIVRVFDKVRAACVWASRRMYRVSRHCAKALGFIVRSKPSSAP